jgi:hypothetical protein
MARMNRMEHYTAMMSRQRPTPVKFTRNEINEFIRRHFKRRMIEQGLLPAKVEKPPKFVWGFSYEGEHSSVTANTRSEARAKIKKLLGLKRLPPHFDLEKIGAN